MLIEQSRLIGTWRLVAWRLVSETQAVDILGEAPHGLLTYTPEGWMSVVISAGQRQPLAERPADRTQAQRAAAFDAVHAYAGRYSVHPGLVVHHVEVSSIPNYEGTDQYRHAHLDNDTLTLTTPIGQGAHLAPGESSFGRLTWQRLSAPAP